MVTTRRGTKLGAARSKQQIGGETTSSTTKSKPSDCSRDSSSGVVDTRTRRRGGGPRSSNELVILQDPSAVVQPTVEELALKAFATMKMCLLSKPGLAMRSQKKAIKKTVLASDSFEATLEEEAMEEEEEEGEEEEEAEEEEEKGVEEEEEESEGGPVMGRRAEKPPELLLLDTKASSSRMKKGHSKHQMELSSSLQPDIQEDSYFDFDTSGAVSQGSCASHMTWGSDKEVMKRSVITADFERKDRVPPVYTSQYALKKARKAEREKSAGKQWFDMPAPALTPELKADLRVLQMRGSLDPSQHYKSLGSKKPPKYFQVGRVVSGPADFYSSRIPKRQRKRTLVEELLADEKFRTYQKKKYRELQVKFQSGLKRRKLIKHNKKYKKS